MHTTHSGKCRDGSDFLGLKDCRSAFRRKLVALVWWTKKWSGTVFRCPGLGSAAFQPTLTSQRVLGFIFLVCRRSAQLLQFCIPHAQSTVDASRTKTTIVRYVGAFDTTYYTKDFDLLVFIIKKTSSGLKFPSVLDLTAIGYLQVR